MHENTQLGKAGNNRQSSLFDVPEARVSLADPRLDSREKPRLSSQREQILALLRKGEASNAQLARISLKYTSRVSDLRRAGHIIRVVKRNIVTGQNWYALGGKE